MRKKNCRIETRSGLVVSVVLEEVDPEMILSCTSCEIVSPLICGDHRRDGDPKRTIKRRESRNTVGARRKCEGI